MRTSLHELDSRPEEVPRPRWVGRRQSVARLLALLASFALTFAPTVALAESLFPFTRLLRVGTSGDYAPFSERLAGAGLYGFDIAIARAYADERGRSRSFVTFRWPGLLRDLEAGNFDVAMSGVTVRPARTTAGRFTVPIVESGAVLLVDQASGWRRADEADTPSVRIGTSTLPP